MATWDDSVKSRDACMGTATAELAIFIPLALVLVLGAVDFGRVLYELTAVENAATAGARYAAHDAAHAGNISGIEAAARDDLRDALAVEDVAVAADRYCACADGAEIDCTTGTCSGGPAAQRAYIRVQVEKPFTTLFDYPGVPHSVTIRRKAEMRLQ